MVSSKVADLGGLLVDDITGVAKVLVNDPLVLDVDEGKEVDKRGGDQSKAPGWDNLDKKVSEESGSEGGNSGVDVLSKDYSLEFNDEEVDQLLEVVGESVESLTADGVVLARAEVGSKASVKDKLAGNLSSSSDCEWLDLCYSLLWTRTIQLTAENNVEALEDVLEEGHVTGEEDEGDDRGV